MKYFQSKGACFCLLTGLSIAGWCCRLDAAQFAPPQMHHTANLIREEGLNSSQLMETLSYLTEVIGPRLTASPAHKQANEWTREKLACWGLTNAHLEAWGPFGKGWSVKRFSAHLVEPQAIPLTAFPKGWSSGLKNPIVAEVVYLNVTNNADLDRFKGKLKGAIVLASPIRPLAPRFEPMAMRLSESNLLRMANASLEPSRRTSTNSPRPAPVASSSSGSTNDEVTEAFRRRYGLQQNSSPALGASTNMPSQRRSISPTRVLSFAEEEGAALLVSASPMGEAGLVFLGSTSVPMTGGTNSSRSFSDMPRAWSTNAPVTLPQIAMGAEDYNRLARMAQQGLKLKMAVDLQVEFHDQDLMAYNTIAEIPGTDLKDEVVMLGGHLDSWHPGTGATDNAVGVAVAMEAVRILKALKLEPRRTIRVALWAGEEQGLLGSRAYVSKHFGYYTNVTEPPPTSALRAPKDERPEKAAPAAEPTTPKTIRKLVRLAEYEKLSAYFNLDNGAGRIRGIYLQGNEALFPYFRRWLEPFRDLDAQTVTVSNTRGTDHTSFDAIGLPGFQFIQDPLDYNTRTHHSNQDVLERIIPEDAKQAAVIMASFVYNAAMLDEKLPRKPVE